MQIAKVRVQLNIVQNDMNEAAQEKNFMKALELKEKMDKLEEELNNLEEEMMESAAMAARPTCLSNAKRKVSAIFGWQCVSLFGKSLGVLTELMNWLNREPK